jgi:hypothetical protein
MRRLKSFFALLLLSVLFTQCQKEVGFVGGPDPVVTTPEPLTANLQGNVFDENDQPAAGVTVRVGNKTATTDARGYFRIPAAALDRKSALVTAEKGGYFKAFRVFNATEGANQVVIKLLKRTLVGTIPAATGGEATLSNGSKVALPANGVVMASSNAAYTGDVRVYAAYIDPTNNDIADAVPGSFLATDRNGNRTTLTSYGMLAVELESPGGDKLQIKSGSQATLTTAIPTAVQGSAPATIPMWYVDETTGIWKEEGSATKQGNAYVGTVKHFSFWNCDVSQNAVIVRMKIVNQNQQPIVHARVRIRRTGSIQGAAYGYTDSLGRVSGYVPNGEALVLEVLDNCHNAFHTQNIGPFTANADLGTIVVANTGTGVITIKGKLLNCGGTPVTSGYAIISVGIWVRYAAVNAAGEFQTTMVNCAASGQMGYSIIGVDSTAQQQGNPATGSVSVPMTDAGNISACGNALAQFINYTFNNTNYALGGNAADSLTARTFPIQGQTGTGFQTNISGMRMNQAINISFGFSHTIQSPGPGTYQLNSISVNGTFGQPVTGSTVTLTAFPTTAGQFYEGTLNAQYSDSSSTTVRTVSATFKVRRN